MIWIGIAIGLAAGILIGIDIGRERTNRVWVEWAEHEHRATWPKDFA